MVGPPAPRMPPPTAPGPTRWAFDGAGIAFRVWARPVVADAGRAVAPATLLWRFPDGTTGRRACRGFLDAIEHASRVVGAAGDGVRLRS